MSFNVSSITSTPVLPTSNLNPSLFPPLLLPLIVPSPSTPVVTENGDKKLHSSVRSNAVVTNPADSFEAFMSRVIQARHVA
nr:hypothetical transcript [Hymenolepis microstoma]CUU98084.1 hypothetical transcript [Hymenolepis microstoma]CUU98085.1 hypothetical transcript [Hymenolepis microstoma]